MSVNKIPKAPIIAIDTGAIVPKFKLSKVILLAQALFNLPIEFKALSFFFLSSLTDFTSIIFVNCVTEVFNGSKMIFG